jgi:glucose-1-phosphate thymidylyltransferase
MMQDSSQLKGLILSGGRGTRLQPFTHTRAKQLMPIANKANLDYAVEDLTRAGITEIGVIVSPETGDAVAQHLGDGSRFGANFTFIRQNEPGGLAHAVRIARDYLGSSAFVMYLGDNLLDGGINHLLDPWRRGEAQACILLTKVNNPSSFGVAVRDATGRVIKLVEKPKEFISDLALVGVYLFTPEIHDVIANLKPSARGELEITDAIQGLVDLGRTVHAEQVKGWWKDTGRPEDLLDANRLILSRLEGDVQGRVEGSSLTGEIFVHSTATVKNSKIRGPVSIAANAVIENSYVGPYTSIGAGARVISSEVEYSILIEGASLENIPNRVDSSILGERASVTGSQGQPSTVQFFLGDGSSVKL